MALIVKISENITEPVKISQQHNRMCYNYSMINQVQVAVTKGQKKHSAKQSKKGEATLDNRQTTFGKKLFLNLHKQAKKTKDEPMINFLDDILEVYKKYGIDEDVK